MADVPMPEKSPPMPPNIVVGDLTLISSEELASSLPNIDISFTCKMCKMKKSSIKAMVEHLTSKECTGLRPGAGVKRARGRPPKSAQQKAASSSKAVGTTSKNASSLLPNAMSTSKRMTRCSTGAIKRRTAMEILGMVKAESGDASADEEEEEDDSPVKQKRFTGCPTGKPAEPGSFPELLKNIKREPSSPTREKTLQAPTSTSLKQVLLDVAEAACNQSGLIDTSLHAEARNQDADIINLNNLDQIARDRSSSIVIVVKDCKVEGGASRDNGSSKNDKSTKVLNMEDLDHEDEFDGELYQDDAEGDADYHPREGQARGRPKRWKPLSKRMISHRSLMRKRSSYEFRCHVCKMRFFATNDELMLHLECHVGGSGDPEHYHCPKCNIENKVWNRFLVHLITHEEYKERLKGTVSVRNVMGAFPCKECGKVFDKKGNWSTHVRKVHNKTDQVCTLCGKVLVGVDDKTFVRHVEKCGSTVYQCELCSYKTKVTMNFRRHMRVHSDAAYKCDQCGALFPTKQRLRVHCMRHIEDRPKYPCQHCGQELVTLDAVKKHIARFHSNAQRQFKCPQCSYMAKLEIDLTKHIKIVHDKKFKCPDCSFMTNSNIAFTQHKEYHLPERILGCPFQNCYYRGCTTQQLANHCHQVHNINSKHQCPICHKLFKKKTSLLRHLVCHTEERPYSCLECGISFYSHSTYYRHRTKTGHDAKREGVASVPQNIMIQYMEEGAEEPGPVQYAAQAEGGVESLLLQQQQEGVMQTMEQQEMAAQLVDPTDADGQEQRIVYIEASESQILEDINGSISIMDNNGEQIVQTIATPDQQSVAHAYNGIIMAPIGSSAGGNLDAIHSGDLTNPGVPVDISLEEHVAHDAFEQVGGQENIPSVEEILVKHFIKESGESAGVQPVDGVTSVEFPGTDSQEGLQDSSQVTYYMTTDDINTGENIETRTISLDEGNLDLGAVQALQEMQGVQQVFYEESVVEVDPPGGGTSDGHQYAIVLLPSGEPEAALSMLQLQSAK